MSGHAQRDAFERFIEPFDAAAIVVTAAADGERAGCLVGFHSQCSIEPPRLAVWISTANHTFRIATAASHVGVHVLGTDDADLAEMFGGETGDEVDKFAHCAWRAGPFGVPLLAGGLRRGVFEIVDRHDVGGDHVLHVLAPVEIDDGATDDGAPLTVGTLDIDPGHPVPPDA